MWTDNADPESITKTKAMQKEVADVESMMHELSLQLSQAVNHIVPSEILMLEPYQNFRWHEKCLVWN